MKIKTTFWAKPIPTMEYDWSAIDDDTYDGAPDSHCPIGYGSTELDAVNDLVRQIEERWEAKLARMERRIESLCECQETDDA